jgi:hypothetical protein
MDEGTSECRQAIVLRPESPMATSASRTDSVGLTRRAIFWLRFWLLLSRGNQAKWGEKPLPKSSTSASCVQNSSIASAYSETHNVDAREFAKVMAGGSVIDTRAGYAPKAGRHCP